MQRFNAFLAELSSDFSRLTTADEIMRIVGAKIGAYFRASRCHFVDIDDVAGVGVITHDWHEDGLASIATDQVYRIADFFSEDLHRAARAGQVVVVHDTRLDPRVDHERSAALDIRAFITAPVVTDGRWRFVVSVSNTVPREWHDEEVALVHELATRVWLRIEHARAEKALRRSEENYRLLFDSIDEGYFIMDVLFDPEGRAVDVLYVDANPAATRMTGADFRGRRLREIDPTYEEFWFEIFGRVARTGTSERLERFAAPNGRWWDFHVSKLGSEPSRRIAVVFQDISERRRVEAALRASAARQAFLLRLHDALRLADPDEVLTIAARLLGEELGVDVACYCEYDDDTDLATVRRAYVRDDTQSITGVYRMSECPSAIAELRALRVVAITDVLYEPLLTDAERTYYAQFLVRSFVAVPLARGGRLVASFQVFRRAPGSFTAEETALLQEVGERAWAVVERARAEAALRTSEARFRTIVENVRDYAIFLLNPSGIITEWTAGAERVQGYAADEVLGRSMRMFYTPEDIAAGEVERELAEAAATGRVEREVWRVRKDGSRFWANEIATAVRDADGHVVGITKISRDLGDQKRLQQQREQLLIAVTAAHAEAERVNRAKDEFLATLSHELRTPLAAILLWGGLLRSGAMPLQELARAVDAIVQSAESQSRLIEDLLDLSRLTSGKLRLTPTNVDVGGIGRAAIDVIRPIARAKRVALDVDVPDDLGTAVLDAARLRQILWNLLSNATKFTPEGGTVLLRLRRRGEYLETEVRDTGEGITAEFMPHIFERFRQADMGETRQHVGLGIGLALSRQLVELHGGTIHAHSEGRGRGATFLVRVPWVEPGARPPADFGAPGAPAARATSPLRGLTVLVVEDDVNTLDAMGWTLERAGATVVPVRGAAEALAALDRPGERAGASAVPDVIVSDLGLPGISGYELIETIAERCRARGQEPPPACAVSAHARDVDRERAFAAGFDVYLAKPVMPERLVEAVEELRDMAEYEGA